jgi:hypothetical protein
VRRFSIIVGIENERLCVKPMTYLPRLLLAAVVLSWQCTACLAAEITPPPPVLSSAYEKRLPRLAMLDPELECDLEDASRVPGWERKMAALNAFLRQELAVRKLYAVLSNEPAADLVARDRNRREVHDCMPCIQDVAQRLGAERVLVVWVFRESELVMWLSAKVVDPVTGDRVVARSMTFRGDNDRAWNKAADFFLRQLAEVPVEQR